MWTQARVRLLHNVHPYSILLVHRVQPDIAQILTGYANVTLKLTRHAA